MTMEELYEYRTELIAISLGIVHELRQVMDTISASGLPASPEAGHSSPHRTLAHLRDIQVQALSGRLLQILREDNPVFVLFDDQGWQESHYRTDEPWQEILEEFTRSHESVLKDLDPCEASIWNRTAHHPWFGKRTFQWWVELCYEYAETHLAQIRSALPGLEE
jgi:hypothetical protein